ncbi:Endonuclease/exonuclease/phosphatase [Scheffersomyces amazonensis]|uniref:Endonuclease/exonuclease/phosphatase n=1 Tax=Scheffersomyces amazonensis TaxID=1078765 RepID=UPI00315D437E
MSKRSNNKFKRIVALSIALISLVGLSVILSIDVENHSVTVKHFGGSSDITSHTHEADQDYEDNINGSGVGRIKSSDEIEDFETEAEEHRSPDTIRPKLQQLKGESGSGSRSGSGSGSGNLKTKPSLSNSGTVDPPSLKKAGKTPEAPTTKKVTPFKGMKASDDDDNYETHEIDPNPHGYLGDITEISDEEKELVGNIYDKSSQSKQLPEGVPNSKEKYEGVLDPTDYPVNSVPLVRKSKLKPFSFRIYSHNVRNGGHKVLDKGEDSWENRFRSITASIKFNCQSNCVVALQEVYKFQLNDIMDDLNRYEPNSWAYYGVGRIDGKDIGEFVPIIYKTNEFVPVYTDSFWLNERNPRISRVGWDAQYPRIVSYGTFKHKLSQNYINVFNTHFDQVGDVAKLGSAKLVIDRMNEINDWPSFLAIDLNAEWVHKSFKHIQTYYTDSKQLATPFNMYGHEKSSVTGFEGQILIDGGRNIDYIFAPKYAIKADDKETCDKINPYEASNKISLRLDAWAMLIPSLMGDTLVIIDS